MLVLREATERTYSMHGYACPRAQRVGSRRVLQEKKFRSDAKRLFLPSPFIKFLTFLPRVLRTNFTFSQTYGGTVWSYESMS